MAVQEMTIDRAIDNAAASTEMEGFVIDEEQKERIRKLVTGELSVEEAVKEIHKKYEYE